MQITPAGGTLGNSDFSFYVNGSNPQRGEFNKKLKLPDGTETLYVKFSTATVNDPSKRDKKSGTEYRFVKKSQDLEISKIRFFDAQQQELSVQIPVLYQGSVMATSVLKPVEAYNTAYLFDAREEFGWASDGKKTNGVGQKLTFNFPKNVNIKKFKIWNGYWRSKEHYQANSRIKKFTLAAGDQKFSFTLKDQMKIQEVEIPQALNDKQFMLTIDEIYPGANYADLVVSELSFSDGNGWFGIFDKQDEENKKTLLTQIQGTPLSKLVDRGIAAEFNGEDYVNYSMVFRSNRSFVIWQSAVDDGGMGNKTLEKVHEGNWQIVSADKNKATIKIFGKNYTVASEYRPYEGTYTDEKTRIFSDTLTIDNQTIAISKVFRIPIALPNQ